MDMSWKHRGEVSSSSGRREKQIATQNLRNPRVGLPRNPPSIHRTITPMGRKQLCFGIAKRHLSLGVAASHDAQGATHSWAL